MKNEKQTAHSTQMVKMGETSVMNINSRNVFNQMIRNIKTDKNNVVIEENINAKNLNDFDGINIVNDDEYFDNILCLVNILSKDIDRY